VAEATVKRLLICVFRRISKAIGQVYQYWWSTCREINVFLQVRISQVYVLYPVVAYLLTLLSTYGSFKAMFKSRTGVRLGKFPVVRRTLFCRRCNFKRQVSAANPQAGQA
jgi:hypothetical protein